MENIHITNAIKMSPLQAKKKSQCKNIQTQRRILNGKNMSFDKGVKYDESKLVHRV